MSLRLLSLSRFSGVTTPPLTDWRTGWLDHLLWATRSAGSTVYAQTWKEKATPCGTRYWAHIPRARTIKDSASTGLPRSGDPSVGWPTPNTPSGGRSVSIEKMDATGKSADGRKHTASLEHAVKFVGWPTPKTPTGGPNSLRDQRGNVGADLREAASLAGWPTPKAEDSEQTGGNRGSADTLHSATQLAGWPTPRAQSSTEDLESLKGRSTKNGANLEGVAQTVGWTTPSATDGSRGGVITPNMTGQSLAQQAPLAGWGTPRVTTNGGTPCPESTGKGSRLEDRVTLVGWTTPSSRDHKDTPGMAQSGVNPDGTERSRLDQLPRQAALVISGQTPSPTSAKTGSCGVLNPAFARRLMSYRAIWDTAAILAHRALEAAKASRRKT